MNALTNLPPDPFTLFSESIEDLLLEANNQLDGKPIETDEQEQAVASILTRLRREASGADDQRKAEKKPHDEAAKAVQQKWAPLLGKADLAIQTAKNALAARLQEKEAAQRAAAEAKAQEARERADAAAQAASAVRPDDLAGQTTVKVLREEANIAAKAAAKADKARPQAKGGERAVGLRKPSYRAEVTDYTAFARWVWAHRRGEMLTFLVAIAQLEAKQPRPIPGIKYHEEERKVV